MNVSWQHYRRVTWTVIVIALLVTAVMIGKLHRGDTKDAEVWYHAGGRVFTGESLVGLRSYRYPPAFAVIIAPLCALPFPAFFLVWYGINLGLFAVSLRLAVSLISPQARWGDLPRYWLPAALVAVFGIDNLFLGQTNIIVMALVYWALLEVSRKREWQAGLPLAAAVAIKVFPVPLLAYFAYRLRIRVILATTLSCLFLLLLLPAPVRGVARNYRETASWWQRVVEPYLSRGKAGDWGQHALDFGNQSLQAVIHRYLTPVNAYVAARDPRRVLYVNFADLTPTQVNGVVLALFALLGASFVAAAGWRRPRNSLAQAAEYSLALILVLLVSALSWTYFFVMLLLPATTAVQLLGAGEQLRPSTIRTLKAALWAIAAALPLLTSAYARALGHVLWATLVLYAALALACRDLRRSANLTETSASAPADLDHKL